MCGCVGVCGVSQLLTMIRMFASNSVHRVFQTVLAPREGGTKLGWRRGKTEEEREERGREEPDSGG